MTCEIVEGSHKAEDGSRPGMVWAIRLTGWRCEETLKYWNSFKMKCFAPIVDWVEQNILVPAGYSVLSTVVAGGHCYKRSDQTCTNVQAQVSISAVLKKTHDCGSVLDPDALHLALTLAVRGQAEWFCIPQCQPLSHSFNISSPDFRKEYAIRPVMRYDVGRPAEPNHRGIWK